MIAGFAGRPLFESGAKYAQYPRGELADMIGTVSTDDVCLVLSESINGSLKTGMPHASVRYTGGVG